MEEPGENSQPVLDTSGIPGVLQCKGHGPQYILKLESSGKREYCHALFGGWERGKLWALSPEECMYT